VGFREREFSKFLGLFFQNFLIFSDFPHFFLPISLFFTHLIFKMGSIYKKNEEMGG